MKYATIAAFAAAALVFGACGDSRSEEMARNVEAMQRLRERARAVPPCTPVTNETGSVMVVETNGAVTVSGALPGRENAGVRLTARASLKVSPKR